MWNIKNKWKQNRWTKQTKANRNKHVDTDNRVVVMRGEGAEGRAKWVKGINFMMETEVFGCEHTVGYTEVEI